VLAAEAGAHAEDSTPVDVSRDANIQ
jgi:hypothetical protein